MVETITRVCALTTAGTTLWTLRKAALQRGYLHTQPILELLTEELSGRITGPMGCHLDSSLHIPGVHLLHSPLMSLYIPSQLQEQG